MRAGARRLLVLLAAALATGCATPPAPTPPPKQDVSAEREAAARDAVRVMENGSAASLTKAAAALSRDGLADTPQGSGPAGFGSWLFSSLYPDIENPFPRSATASSQPPAFSDFFTRLAPALSLLVAGAKLDDAAADDALNAVSQADNLRPDSVLPPYLRATVLERQDRPADAVRPVYEECLRRDPAFYPAKMGIIRSAVAQGRAGAELPALAKEASELPAPALTYEALARVNLAAGQPRQAADAAARALLAAPESPDLIVLRARAFEAMGDWYHALSQLDSLLRVKPDVAEAIALKAEILLEKANNPDGALRVAAEAENRFPNDPAFPELRGRILLSRGNSALGEAALTRSLQLDPSRASALALLADSAASSQRWQEASAYLARIPAPARTADVLKLGWRIAMNLGDNDQALSFAAALGRKVGGDEPVLLTVRTQLAAGKIQEALDLIASGLTAAASSASRATFYLLRSRAERQTGGADAAMADLRLALRENPDDLESLRDITDLLADNHEYRRALNYLKHAQELAPSD
ncbi:MAG TPA: hypothetical protein VMV03_16490, partial [Spirochaetia bacterium]|nr:hypothetical protein [Spirochaetia bacterium]